MAFVVVYDTCVLFPNTVRDLLIRVAQHGLVQAKWTETILAELRRSLKRERNIDDAKLDSLLDLMNRSVRDVNVTGYEALIGSVELPDPDDRHVVAAAIRCNAQVIVTDNQKDFPTDALAQYDIETRSADDFLLDQVSIDRAAVQDCVEQIAESRRSSVATVEDVLADLRRCGALKTAAELQPTLLTRPASVRIARSG